MDGIASTVAPVANESHQRAPTMSHIDIETNAQDKLNNVAITEMQRMPNG